MNQEDPEFQATFKKISKSISSKFRFGYYEKEDIEQEVYILCVNALERYDSSQPLENFLWTHVKNRLCNLKRNKYERKETPCLKCPLYDKLRQVNDSQCQKFEDKCDCDLYKKWVYRNNAKKALSGASSSKETSIIQANDVRKELNNHEHAEMEEIFNIIDRELPAELRQDYVKYKYGVRLKKATVAALLETLRSILERNGIHNVY